MSELFIETKFMGSSTGSIEISSIDNDGEVYIECINKYDEVVNKFINKDQARQIIEHLKAQFEL